MRAWRTLLVCGGITSVVFSQDAPAKPDTPEQAADKVLAAFTAKDAAALKALAEKDDPDPWLVADELCARSQLDPAEAFAKAAPRPDTEKLPAYLESRPGKAVDVKARKALGTFYEAFAGKDFAGALKAVEALQPARGDEIAVVRVACARGRALRALSKHAESADALLAAGREAEGMGWLALAAACFKEAGSSRNDRDDYQGALEAWERRLEIENRRENRTGIAKALGGIGMVLDSLGHYSKALEYQERSLKLREEIRDRAGIAASLGDIGKIHQALANYAKALEYYGRSLRLKEEIGDTKGIALTLGNIGTVHLALGDYAKALDHLERSLKLREELGDRAGIASALGNIGIIYQKLGDQPRALEYYRRSLKLKEELGDRAGIATTLGNIGCTYVLLGDYHKALECLDRALSLKEELGDRAGFASTLGNIGQTHSLLGDYPTALECLERSLKIQEELGARKGIADALGNLGNIHRSLGDHPRALDYYLRALKFTEETGDRAGTATNLGNLGGIYHALGDYPKALAYQERALKIQDEIGDRRGSALTLGNIGLAYQGLGDYPRALTCQERALKAREEVGDRAGIAITLGNIGNIHAVLRDYRKALEYYGRSLKLKEEIGDRAGIGATLQSIGMTHIRMQHFATAVEDLERADQIALELGAPEPWCLGALAAAHLGLGAYRDALQCAHRAVDGIPLLVRGLEDEEGARARERFVNVFEIGIVAGVRLGDADEVAFFLESGRAGSLLESLGGRAALRGIAIPAELSRLESDAEAAERTAAALHQAALKSGVRAEIQARRQELDRTREKFGEAVARIQREAKRVADVRYPEAKTVAEIAKGLGEADALVLYGLGSQTAQALVVTRSGAWIVNLRPPKEIEAAPVEKLKELLIDPLRLGATTKRLLVSPQGALAEVPFVLLAGGRDVAYVPSGTTYLLLLEERTLKGKGVLGLGDPDYAAKIDKKALDVFLRGSALGALPATRKEVKAIATTTLLGADATAEKLRKAIPKSPRWRAVHLACHGFIDPERPALSSLALTGGFLSTLDVFRMQIPADLVVVSACETARGKVYRAEGVVGFVRAFMFAGAPRVIVSLWKVDDEATQALMVKFYELWNPKGGSKGLPCATALRKAQEYIASQPKWKDPKYWAAWQLWGLPD